MARGIGYYLDEPETTPRGAVLHWEDESRQSPAGRAHIRVTYPCCGQDRVRSVNKLGDLRDPTRTDPAVCEDCLHAPTPEDVLRANRPTCPRCGKRPVVGRYRQGVLRAWGRCCWPCSIAYVDRRTMDAQRAQRKASAVSRKD